MNTLIGLIGQSGSGKDTVARLLCEKYGFEHVSLSEELRSLIRERNLEINTRSELSKYADSLRREQGAAFLIQNVIDRNTSDKLVVSGIYGTQEAKALRMVGGRIVAIAASPECRYARISKRNDERDQIAYDDFLIQSQNELSSAYEGRIRIKDADTEIMNEYGFEVLDSSIKKLLASL